LVIAVAKSKRRTKARGGRSALSPQEKLLDLTQRAIDLSKTARRNKKPLAGQNFYADKIVELRADATNCYRDLAIHGVGDDATLAELVGLVFAANTKPKERTAAARELYYALKTTYKPTSATVEATDDIFPLSILTKTGRGYYVSIGRQLNGAFQSDWFDACAVMMRRLLEITIIEAFENSGLDAKVKDSAGDFFQLSGLIKAALAEKKWNLSRNTKKALPHLRDLGHTSAHGRYYIARRSDIENVRRDYRLALEEFLHIAGRT